MYTLSNNSSLKGGEYKILSVLGQGGFGITYLAEQVMLERKVALKEFFMKEYCGRDETNHMTIGTDGIGTLSTDSEPSSSKKRATSLASTILASYISSMSSRRMERHTTSWNMPLEGLLHRN